ncbi:hypothetical protein GVN21_12610 [Caulobacter sp. SLTY]|uniref:hypothetical protein n=1 Tax=Caulobacter sp. SLTY TaxID=2683262 RepID=UPI001413018B|nr:hypothetical protein [Caulobacter sp. SLTY]NBB16201.1 hypothetical protein [Caulobacter sp. SLTY]
MRRALVLPLVLAAGAVLLQGCLAASIAGDVAEGTVKATGAVVSAVIPGESKKQRLERLDREDKARKKAERKAEKERRKRERERD